MTPLFTPFSNALISCLLRSGGITLKWVSNSSKLSSVNHKLCKATLQLTSSPFFLASAIRATLLAVEIVGICKEPPVYSKIKRSLATCNSSARAGIPFNPNLVEVIPSFTIPFPAIFSSIGKEYTSPLKLWVYCNAILRRLELAIGCLWSEKPTAPEFFISKISERSVPSPFTVKVPRGYTSVAYPAALLFKNTMSELLSGIGWEVGFNTTAVNPLLAATNNPFSMVSLSSKPGSPKLTLVSNHP